MIPKQANGSIYLDFRVVGEACVMDRPSRPVAGKRTRKREIAIRVYFSTFLISTGMPMAKMNYGNIIIRNVS